MPFFSSNQKLNESGVDTGSISDKRQGDKSGMKQCSRKPVSTSADVIGIWKGHEYRFIPPDIHRPRSLNSDEQTVLSSSKW